MNDDIRLEWLRKKTTINKIEKFLGLIIDIKKDIPWQNFKKKVKRGDEIWKFDSAINDIPSDEQYLGYAIVREYKIVDYLLF